MFIEFIHYFLIYFFCRGLNGCYAFGIISVKIGRDEQETIGVYLYLVMTIFLIWDEVPTMVEIAICFNLIVDSIMYHFHYGQ